MLTPSLHKHMLLVASSGGNCDEVITGIEVVLLRTDGRSSLNLDVEVEDEEEVFISIQRSTSKEFIFDGVQRQFEYSNTADVRMESILETIETAKTSFPFSSLFFTQSRAANWKGLLFSEKLSDVTFVCPNGETHYFHQVVLSCDSPYVEAYFTGP
jgi:hypothetical protein